MLWVVGIQTPYLRRPHLQIGNHVSLNFRTRDGIGVVRKFAWG